MSEKFSALKREISHSLFGKTLRLRKGPVQSDPVFYFLNADLNLIFVKTFLVWSGKSPPIIQP